MAASKYSIQIVSCTKGKMNMESFELFTTTEDKNKLKRAAAELNFALNPVYRKKRFLSLINKIIKDPSYPDGIQNGEFGYISKTAWDILTVDQQSYLINQYCHQGYDLVYDSNDCIYVLRLREKDILRSIRESLLDLKVCLSDLEEFYIYF
jgi:hypothetical protein